MGMLDGKVALITGSTSGIGQATVELFAKEGATVVASGRNKRAGRELVRRIEEGGGRATFIEADVLSAGSVNSLVSKAVREFGRLDCAVNCAGAEGRSASTSQYSLDDYNEIADVNLRGAWLSIKHEIEQMVSQTPRGGVIVNVTSINGLGGVAGGSIYAAAKAGVIALTKSAAQEFASQGVRLNALVLGPFDTPMFQRAKMTQSGGDKELAEKLERQFLELIPAARIGRAAEAAEAALWLCSSRSSYVFGHSLIVDGGLTAWAR